MSVSRAPSLPNSPSRGRGRRRLRRSGGPGRTVDVATHVSERAGPEAYALAPFARVVGILPERARAVHAQPLVPGERRGHRIGIRRQRLVVAPALVREGVHFANLANDPA